MTDGPAASAQPVTSLRSNAAPDHFLIAVVLSFSALAVIFHMVGMMDRPVESSDFFVFWSAAGFLADGAAVEGLYEAERFAAYQATFPWGSPEVQPFPYPPSMAVLLRPLAWLDYPSAKLVWLALSFALLVWALDAGRQPVRLLVLVVAPACLINLAFAQNAFLLTALIAGGLLRAGHQPVIAGFLLGLATIKPQLGLVVPIFLVLQGRWTVIGVASLGALTIVGLSIVVDGLAAWQAWFGQLGAFGERTIENIDRLAPYLASLTAALIAAGAPVALAQTAQLAVAIGALSWLLLTLRRCDAACGVAIVLAATFLVTPFAYVYDTVLLVPAIVLLTKRFLQYARAGNPIRFGSVVLVFAWLAPFLSILLMPMGIPIVALASLGLMSLAWPQPAERS